MRARAVLRVALLGGIVGSPAAADHLNATLEQPLAEISHHVEARIDDGVATYVVQRQFKNRGAIADEVRLEIELPDGAAATGLRIRAGNVWHAGELLEAQEAARTYRALTGRGVATLKDPALLWYRGQGRLFLQVFPVKPRGGVTTVEYTLTVPTRYAQGRYGLTYPRGRGADGSLALVDPTIAVRAIPGATAPILLDGKRIAAGTRARIAALPPVAPDNEYDAPSHAELAIAPPTVFPGAPWQARLGRVIASDKHAFSRLEVDVAPQLAQLPKRAQVVFVVDASFSVGEDGLAAQLAMIRAYARHVPDAELEVVAYRRTAQRVFGAFVPANKLGAALDDATRRGRLALGNGSALDAGGRLAAEALRGRPGPHRVVITTDELVRSTLDDALALAAVAALDPAAVVHVVVPSSDGELSFVRDDDASLAAVATKHHGIFARLGGLGRGTSVVALAKPVLELVRPVRIDHLAIGGGFVVDSSLAEGEGLRLACRAGVTSCPTAAPTDVAITGQLWSDPIRLAVTEQPAFSRATAAFVIGEAHADDLSDAEVMTIARQGRAVSRVTSYLAIEPGVRPSKEGLPEDGSGVGWGTIGMGQYGTMGRPGISLPKPPGLASLVDTRACEPLDDGSSVTLAVETTRDEIVDVRTATTGPFAACLVEAVWKTRLDGRFVLSHQTHKVLLP